MRPAPGTKRSARKHSRRTGIPAARAERPGSTDGTGDQDRGRAESVIGAFIVHESEADLLQVIRALNPSCGFARRLNRREQQCDQYGDDGDDDKKLDQGKTTSNTLTRRGLGHRRTLRRMLGIQTRSSDRAVGPISYCLSPALRVYLRRRLHEESMIWTDPALWCVGTVAEVETGDLFTTDEVGPVRTKSRSLAEFC